MIRLIFFFVVLLFEKKIGRTVWDLQHVGFLKPFNSLYIHILIIIYPLRRDVKQVSTLAPRINATFDYAMSMV